MNRRTSLSFVALSLALSACSSSSAPADGDAVLDADESEVRACSESYARKWVVTLRDRACANVEGAHGTWVAVPLEEGASDAVCTMTWEGERYSRADMDALRAFVRVNVDAMVPTCSGAVVDVGALTPIPHIDMLAQVGANGCDVCGKLRRDGKIIVILPPFLTSLRQFEVPLTDGTARAFQVDAPPGAHAVSVQLPPPPPGAQYAASRVTVY